MLPPGPRILPSTLSPSALQGLGAHILPQSSCACSSLASEGFSMWLALLMQAGPCSDSSPSPPSPSPFYLPLLIRSARSPSLHPAQGPGRVAVLPAWIGTMPSGFYSAENRKGGVRRPGLSPCRVAAAHWPPQWPWPQLLAKGSPNSLPPGLVTAPPLPVLTQVRLHVLCSPISSSTF